MYILIMEVIMFCLRYIIDYIFLGFLLSFIICYLFFIYKLVFLKRGVIFVVDDFNNNIFWFSYEKIIYNLIIIGREKERDLVVRRGSLMYFNW